jgi:hypothetical protein
VKEKTMSANTDKCADSDKSVCDYNEFRRLRYFHGMLLDDKDFQAEQQYHAGKRRLLNRMLHGSGVVCGLDLKGKKDTRFIEISSGLALDCSGNEIWVQKNKPIDLASLLPPKEKPKPNAECREEDEGDDLKTYYIGIRYEEKPTNPVSVYLPSGSCEEKTCENSRYKEGYCIEIVECCPEKYPPGLIKNLCECEKGDKPDASNQLCRDCGELLQDTGAGKKTYDGQTPETMESWCKCVRLEEFCEQSVGCPDCCSCEKPCHVILGQIKVDNECRLKSLCINECRRYVLTGRLVQHMLLGVFAGSEEFFYADVNGQEISIPDVGELVNNPIKALCWALRYLMVEGGEFKTRPCTPQAQPPPPPPPEKQFRVLEAQVQTLNDRTAALVADLERFRRDQDQRLNLVERATATDTQPAAEKPQKPGGKK